MDLYRVLRPVLFALPADMAHDVSLWAFRRRFWSRLPIVRPPTLELRTRIGGMEMDNPFGLAAGFDKNGDITASMMSLGFGFTVVGSVRPGPHPGNPRPWFVRRREEGGLVNSMGLPSKGPAHVRRRLRGLKTKVPVLVSVVGETPADFVQVYENLEGVARAWEVNLSCPNTATGRTFEEDLDAFDGLLTALKPLPRPAFLKLSPYEDEEGRERALEMGNRAVRRGFQNFTLCNTLPVEERRLGVGRGGLSGRPLFPLALQVVRDFRDEWGDKVNIIGVGGILSGAQAFEMLAAGAQALEVLTALILRGPLVIGQLIEELEEVMKAKGFQTVEEVVSHEA
ncbi:MAG: dihydroorotate dehydrogenase 2 [Thermoplasmata archaeon]